MRRAREETLLVRRGAARLGRADVHAARGRGEPGRAAGPAGRPPARSGTDPRLGELLDAARGLRPGGRSGRPAGGQRPRARRVYDRSSALPRRWSRRSPGPPRWPSRSGVGPRRGGLRALPPVARAIVALKRAEAECLGYADEPYDALLDEYEPGLRSDGRRPAVRGAPPRAGAARGAIAHAARRPDASVLRRDFPLDRQRLFGEAVAAAVGFDFGRGRLDLGGTRSAAASAPATAASPRASTTATSRRALQHPARGRPRPLRAGPGPASTTARRWARPLGRDPRGAGPPLGEPGRPRPALLGALLSAGAASSSPRPSATSRSTTSTSRSTTSRPSLIRVQADEVTYNLHILIRFELERALVSGDLPVGRPAGAWNEAYRDVLGVTRGRRRGLPAGRPLGAADRLLPDLHAGQPVRRPALCLRPSGAGRPGRAVRARRVRRAGAMARRRVYRQGRRYPSARLIELVTGSPPDHRPLVRILKAKYEELYGLWTVADRS